MLLLWGEVEDYENSSYYGNKIDFSEDYYYYFLKIVFVLIPYTLLIREESWSPLWEFHSVNYRECNKSWKHSIICRKYHTIRRLYRSWILSFMLTSIVMHYGRANGKYTSVICNLYYFLRIFNLMDDRFIHVLKWKCG